MAPAKVVRRELGDARFQVALLDHPIDQLRGDVAGGQLPALRDAAEEAAGPAAANTQPGLECSLGSGREVGDPLLVALAAHPERLVPGLEVGELEPGSLGAPQVYAVEQGQDRSIPSPERLIASSVRETDRPRSSRCPLTPFTSIVFSRVSRSSQPRRRRSEMWLRRRSCGARRLLERVPAPVFGRANFGGISIR